PQSHTLSLHDALPISCGVWTTGFSTGFAAAPYPAPRSLMPSSQTTCVSPDSPSTSRSSRSTAAGPEAAFATTGLMTRLTHVIWRSEEHTSELQSRFDL